MKPLVTGEGAEVHGIVIASLNFTAIGNIGYGYVGCPLAARSLAWHKPAQQTPTARTFLLVVDEGDDPA
jgi:hypothetical protein